MQKLILCLLLVICLSSINAFGYSGGSGTPEDIRDYIRDMYTTSNIEYVIIGGDDDVIPAKDLYVQAYPGGYIEYNMPSDVYYACLDGTYNYDGDSQWGEPNDGEGGGDVDLIAEVYVGRASVGSTSEVDNFVDKTIDYLQTADEYLQDVLWVGEYLGFGGIAEWGGNYKDEMIGGSSNHGYTTVGVPIGPDDFTVSYLYERDMSWGKTQIMNYMNSGIHFLNHLGHGSSNYAMHMYNPDCVALTNDKYFFVYSQTCSAGHFDGTDCWAEQINIKTGHGAFAVIMNARYGWGVHYSTDGPSQRFDREFWDAVFNENECRECYRCVEICPTKAINHYLAHDEFEEQWIVNPDLCIGCGVCTITCQTDSLKLHRFERPGKPFETRVEFALTVARDNDRL